MLRRSGVEICVSTPRNHGIELDSVAFNAAMTAALEAGHADQALQLMRGMTQKLGSQREFHMLKNHARWGKQ